MYNRDVTKANKQNGRRKIGNVYRDKHVFSKTAGSTHVINSSAPARPMRGGIRL